MIKTLRIHNLLLIESCTLELAQGFTVLTGESGSGKTALVHSIKLLLGQRFDSSLLRTGAKKGFVQATFTNLSQEFRHHFDIDEELLTLHREVSMEGKSKAFANDRPISMAILQQMGSQLVRIVDQNSHEELRHAGCARDLLDQFASLTSYVEAFASLVTSYKQTQEQEKLLFLRQAKKERELSFMQAQEQELSSFTLSSETEEELFREYTLHANAQESLEKIAHILSCLQGNKAVLPQIQQALTMTSSLAPLHTLFTEIKEQLQHALISMQEAIYLLQQADNLFTLDTERFIFLENTLHHATLIKKKYGNPEERNNYLKELQEELLRFSNLEWELEEVQTQLRSLQQMLNEKAQELSKLRASAAGIFASSIKETLRALHMEQAEFAIAIQPTTRSTTGDDCVMFLLGANLGEALLPLQESASGGELSRILLAIVLVLCDKNPTPTLIFDEIDANVGGQTARKIGEQLHLLSKEKQVLCITHFPQVARQADHHLCARKQLHEERTITLLRLLLDAKERGEEDLRMQGEVEIY